jgi:hypothetical protein
MRRMQTLFLALSLVVLVATALEAQQEPPRRLDFSREGEVQEQPAPLDTIERRTQRDVGNAFVRSQTILGLTVYGPSFAVMVGDEPATRLAAYLVMAGGSFFAATELTRQMEITPARQFLSSRMAVRGAASGLLLGYATRMRDTEMAATTLIGGLGGTAAGLLIGRGLTEGEAVATVAGHDILAASAYALTYIVNPSDASNGGMSRTTRLGIPLAVGLGGYALGRHYAGNAPYEVTAGDANLLWLGATIGATAGLAVVAESDPPIQTIAGAVLGGGLFGVWGADRFLVRRYDHSRAEATMVSLGGLAGSIMGIGMGVLLSGDAERWDATTLGFGALGAIGGVALTERYLQPARDAGRQQFGFLERLQVSPGAALAAASGTPGMHSIVRFTF